MAYLEHFYIDEFEKTGVGELWGLYKCTKRAEVIQTTKSKRAPTGARFLIPS